MEDSKEISEKKLLTTRASQPRKALLTPRHRRPLSQRPLWPRRGCHRRETSSRRRHAGERTDGRAPRDRSAGATARVVARKLPAPASTCQSGPGRGGASATAQDNEYDRASSTASPASSTSGPAAPARAEIKLVAGGRRKGPQGPRGAPACLAAAVTRCPAPRGDISETGSRTRRPRTGSGPSPPAPLAPGPRHPAPAGGRHPQSALSPGRGRCPGPQALGRRHPRPAAAFFTCCVAAAARFYSPGESRVVVAAAAATPVAAANSPPPPPQCAPSTAHTFKELCLQQAGAGALIRRCFGCVAERRAQHVADPLRTPAVWPFRGHPCSPPSLG
ncbi:uncharacterized protein LOC144312017 [Canis aureus]